MADEVRAHNAEHLRQLVARREQPCVMAVVPSRFPNGTPKRFRSWHLCRRRKDSEVIFGWHPVHDPEPPEDLEPGTRVLCRKEGKHGWCVSLATAHEVAKTVNHGGI